MKTRKCRISDLNPHLICVLCGGYFIDATTVIECLHSFCRTCIVRYLETSKFCPICDVQVHKTKPLQNIRTDKTLQDLVYKLVPGLFREEMHRRKDFYTGEAIAPVSTHTSISGCRLMKEERLIFSEDEKISLSLELSHNGRPPDENVHNANGLKSPRRPENRYLLCPAAVTICLLKKFIRLKYSLPPQIQVDIFQTQDYYRDNYTLMDVAYISMWKRDGPLRLYYTMWEPAPKKQKLSPEITTSTKPTVLPKSPLLFEPKRKVTSEEKTTCIERVCEKISNKQQQQLTCLEPVHNKGISHDKPKCVEPVHKGISHDKPKCVEPVRKGIYQDQEKTACVEPMQKFIFHETAFSKEPVCKAISREKPSDITQKRVAPLIITISRDVAREAVPLAENSCDVPISVPIVAAEVKADDSMNEDNNNNNKSNSNIVMAPPEDMDRPSTPLPVDTMEITNTEQKAAAADLAEQTAPPVTQTPVIEKSVESERVELEAIVRIQTNNFEIEATDDDQPTNLSLSKKTIPSDQPTNLSLVNRYSARDISTSHKPMMSHVPSCSPPHCQPPIAHRGSPGSSPPPAHQVSPGHTPPNITNMAPSPAHEKQPQTPPLDHVFPVSPKDVKQEPIDMNSESQLRILPKQ